MLQVVQAFCHRRQCTVEPAAAAADCEHTFRPRPWCSKLWWRVHRIGHVTSARSHARQEKTTSHHSGHFHALDSSLFRSTHQFLGYVHPDPRYKFTVQPPTQPPSEQTSCFSGNRSVRSLSRGKWIIGATACLPCVTIK